MRSFFFLLLPLVLLLGCGPTGSGVAHPEPEPVINEQPGKELCPKACAHMSTLADGGPCEEATDVPLKDGGSMTCEQFCTYQHENGIFWNTECLVNITACVQVEKCATPPP